MTYYNLFEVIINTYYYFYYILLYLIVSPSYATRDQKICSVGPLMLLVDRVIIIIMVGIVDS